MNKKKAQGHVEIIFSFILFVGVMLFLFLYLNPFAEVKEEKSNIDSIHNSIINRVSSNVGKLSIITNVDEGCYELSGTEYSGRSFIEIQNPPYIRKYTLYFSDGDFQDTGVSHNKPSGECLLNTWELGIYQKEEMIVYGKIKDLKESYDENYANLKIILGINDDFSFSVRTIKEGDVLDDDLSVIKKVPVGVDVKSTDFPIRAIDENGKIHQLILNIRVW